MVREGVGGGGGGEKRAEKLAKLHPQVCLDHLKYC